MRRRHGFQTALASLGSAIAIFGLSFPAAAPAAGLGSAVANSGLVADVAANTPSNNQVFDFKMVVPSGTCTGGSLVPGVDFCKPWATLAVAYHDGRSDSSGLGGGVRCSNVTNPTSWSDGYPVMNPRWGAERAVKPRSGIYADLACEDGSVYDFYRVVIDNQSDADGPWGLFDGQVWGIGGTSALSAAPITWTWGTYRGVTKFAHDNGASEAGHARVYGRDARGLHLLAGGAAKVFPVAAHVVTTAGGATTQ